MPKINDNIVSRILKKVVFHSEGWECWEWTGAKLPKGYGVISYLNKQQYVHRLMYENVVGEIPFGYQLDHLCRFTACVNPDHLEAVTPRVNVLRGNSSPARNARLTHCKRGHPFDAANTYHGKYGRMCRRCHADHQARYREVMRGT